MHACPCVCGCVWGGSLHRTSTNVQRRHLRTIPLSRLLPAVMEEVPLLWKDPPARIQRGGGGGRRNSGPCSHKGGGGVSGPLMKRLASPAEPLTGKRARAVDTTSSLPLDRGASGASGSLAGGGMVPPAAPAPACCSPKSLPPTPEPCGHRTSPSAGPPSSASMGAAPVGAALGVHFHSDVVDGNRFFRYGGGGGRGRRVVGPPVPWAQP
jgi:hypothetical protein